MGVDIAATSRISVQNNRNHKSQFLIDSAVQAVDLVWSGIGKWELVPFAVTGWNIHKFRQTLVKLDEGLRKQRRIVNGIERFPLLIDSPRLEQNVSERRQAAIEELIRRCYLNLSVYGIRILKISSIFIQQPFVRKGFEGACNAAAHGLLLCEHITTQNPRCVLFRGSRTAKDNAFRLFKIIASMLGMISGLLVIANVSGCIDDSDDFFLLAKRGVFVAFVADGGYAVLQHFGYVAERE